MKVVGLVSSFREGPMAASAIRSCAALDACVCFEGPVENNPASGPKSVIPEQRNLFLVRGEWASDAAKRTAMVDWVKKRSWLVSDPAGVWGVWVDGDEILLNGDQLGDWLWRVSQQGDPENPVGGWPFPLVELDGSTSLCMGKCVRVDLIARYLISSSYIELVNGDRRTVGNVEYWNPVEGPKVLVEETGLPHWRARPPLQGEPHLQHRPVLRSRLRTVERQHAAEARGFEGVELG